MPSHGLPYRTLARYLIERCASALCLGVPLFVWHRPSSVRADFSIGVFAPMTRSYLRLLAQDLDNARSGKYPAVLLSSSRTFRTIASAIWVVREYFRFLQRRRTNDVRAVPSLEELERGLVGVWAELDIRDGQLRKHGIDALRFNWDTYARTFHWQRDGYLSRSSARLYEATVEFSLAGVVDVMRRMALPPLLEAVAHQADPKIIDVSAGTGRFLHLVSRVLPNARLTANELSPFYLCEAKALLPAGTECIAGDAANVPRGDGTFDVVVVSYVLHELPTEKRLAVLREAKRLVAPDGVVVVYESIQSDAANSLTAELFDATKDVFAALSYEPFYGSFASESVVDMMRDVGLRTYLHEDHYVTKVIAARPSGLRSVARQGA